jgi:hypothetical protein
LLTPSVHETGLNNYNLPMTPFYTKPTESPDKNLISPKSIFVITRKAVDDDWNWQSENKNSDQSAKSANRFPGDRRRRLSAITN